MATETGDRPISTDSASPVETSEGTASPSSMPGLAGTVETPSSSPRLPPAGDQNADASPAGDLDRPLSRLEILAWGAQLAQTSFLTITEWLMIVIDCEKRGYKEQFTRNLLINVRTRREYQFSQQSGIDQARWVKYGVPWDPRDLEGNVSEPLGSRQNDDEFEVLQNDTGNKYMPRDLQEDKDTDIEDHGMSSPVHDLSPPDGMRVIYRSTNASRVGAKKAPSGYDQDPDPEQEETPKRQNTQDRPRHRLPEHPAPAIELPKSRHQRMAVKRNKVDKCLHKTQSDPT